MSTIHAVYENGIFRPTEPVELPDQCEVEFEPRVVRTEEDRQHLERVRDFLAGRYETGIPDLAARHDEHQP